MADQVRAGIVGAGFIGAVHAHAVRAAGGVVARVVASHPGAVRRAVERYGEQCYHCGDGPFECIDHLICVRVGGTHTRENVVPCCLACNRRKRWTVDEGLIRAYLLSTRAAA